MKMPAPSKKPVVILTAAAVIAFAAMIGTYAYAFREMKGLQIELDAPEPVSVIKTPEVVPKTQESAKKSQESPESVTTASQIVTNPQPPQPAPEQKTAAVGDQVSHEPNKLEGGHIPFTNEPVTPGKGDSYIGTVGQCPFYEMAGEKGCYPPADIECNDDWSVCKPKEQQ